MPVVAGRFSVVPALRRLGVAPLPAVIGAGLALERGEGNRQLPVRPALVSAVAAVLGVVGAFGLPTPTGPASFGTPTSSPARR